jgi:hypothetical protein
MNTEGRTENSSELTTEEIELLIHALETCGMEAVRPESDFLRGDTMRKRILSLFYQYGYTEFSAKKKRLVVDFERMDAWMLKYGYLHKNLNKYKYSELPKLVTQVEQVVTKYIESF